MSLPITFGILMAFAVMLGVYASWQSLRAVFRAGHIRDLPSIDVSEARRALEDEKAAVLGNIRDLRFEHEAGKIADDDFERQDTKLRARAREVLRLLDEDMDDYVRRAEKMIVSSLGPDSRSPYRAAADGEEKSESESDSAPLATVHACPSCQVDNDPDAEFCKKCGASLAAPTCVACRTENDADAEFCKKCGMKLASETTKSDDASEDDTSEKDASETTKSEDASEKDVSKDDASKETEAADLSDEAVPAKLEEDASEDGEAEEERS